MTPRYQRETECSNAVVQLKTFCKLLWWGHCQSRVIFILKRSFLPVLHALKLFPFVHWFQNCFMWTDGEMVINAWPFSCLRTSSSTWYYPGYVLPCENLGKYAVNPSCKFINLPLWWIRRSLAVSLFCLRLFASAAPSSMQRINLSVDGWTTPVLICLLGKTFEIVQDSCVHLSLTKSVNRPFEKSESWK